MQSILDRYHGLGWVVGWVLGLAAGVGAQPQMPQVSVYLEDSPAAAELMDQAQRLRGEDRIAEAVRVYQRLLDQYPRKLKPKAASLHGDTVGWVREAIRSAPRLLASYRRLQEPIAQRALEQAAAQADGAGFDTTAIQRQAKALEGVLSAYWPCDAGLEAGLRLAGLYLEAGQPSFAATALDELVDHPNLSAQQARWHRLQAAVGLFAQLPDRYTQHLQALQARGESQAVDRLKAWSDQLRVPVFTHGVSSLDPTPVVELPDPLGVPLWKHALLPEPPEQGNAVTLNHGGRLRIRGRVRIRHRGVRGSPWVFPLVPVAVEDRLYLTNTHEVAALDRSSGRLYWSYQTTEADDTSPQPGAKHGWAGAVQLSLLGAMEQRAAAVLEDRLVAVLGVPSTIRPGLRRDLGGTRLVCLDRNQGRLVWQREPGQLDPLLVSADFYGTAVMGLEHVFALVRRNQRAGFQDTYLLAIHLQTGQLVWRRHLFSVTADRYTTQGLVQAMAHGGRLYVADDLGNAACLDARNGSIVWLTVLSQRLGRQDNKRIPHRVAKPKWLTARPVWVDAGLVIGVQAQPPTAAVLDPETGQVRQYLNDPRWGESISLTSVAGDLLIMGASIQRRNGQDLSLRWTQALGDSVDNLPHGLTAVTQNRVLVPMRDQLAVLDFADGRLLAQHAIERPGNVLALPDQVLIAGTYWVRSYLTWERAYEHLTHQIASHPDDPQPALALAHVSLAAHKHEAVIEAVDLAIASLARRIETATHRLESPTSVSPVQRRVFNQVLELIDPDQTPSVALRGVLFDRLATLTLDPGDEVVYHLKRAAYSEEIEKPDRAVDHYQAVLKNTTLASQMYHHASGRRQAGIEAKTQIARVIEQAGPWVYERYEAESAQRLIELTQDASSDAQALLDLAKQYPFSRTAPQALLAGAQVLAQQGQAPAALGQLRRAYRYATEPALVQRIVGLMVTLHEQAKQSHRATHWLVRVKRDYPGLKPLHDGRPMAVDQWLERLAGQPAMDQRLPCLAWPFGAPRVLPERLLTPTHQRPNSWPRDSIVTALDRQVRLRQGVSLEPRWSTPTHAPDLELLSISAQQLLLWSDRLGQLIALDTQTGQPMWPTVEVAPQLQPHDQHQRQAHQAKPPLPRLGPKRPNAPAPVQQAVVRQGRWGQARHHRLTPKGRFMVAVNEMVVCVGDPTGRLIGVDRRTGQVAWRIESELTQLDRLAIDDDAVALGGRHGGPSDSPVGGVVVLDPATGDQLYPMLTDAMPIQWLGLNGHGLLFYATAHQAVAHDLHSGEPEWGLDLQAHSFRGWGWVGDDLLLISTNPFNGTLLMIAPTTGRVMNRLVNLFPTGVDTITTQEADGRLYVQLPHRAWSIGRTGQAQWGDAIFQENNPSRAIQAVSQQHVALIGQADPDDAGLGYRLYLLDRNTGSIQHEHALSSINKPIDPGHGYLIDDALVIGTGSGTLVIPSARRVDEPGDQPHR